MPTSDRPFDDPIAALMAFTAEGYYSRIRYRKGGKTGDTERVIEPRQLVDGAYGMMVRALQIEPESGVRCFCCHKILLVTRDQRELPPTARKGNNFCTGEIVSFDSRSIVLAVPDAPTRPTPATAKSATRSAWSQQWFREYAFGVRSAITDLRIEPAEATQLAQLRDKLGISEAQVRAVHAYILGEELLGLSTDAELSETDTDYLTHVTVCLGHLGWSPA